MRCLIFFRLPGNLEGWGSTARAYMYHLMFLFMSDIRDCSHDSCGMYGLRYIYLKRANIVRLENRSEKLLYIPRTFHKLYLHHYSNTYSL